jgi:hypothetical protein
MVSAVCWRGKQRIRQLLRTRQPLRTRQLLRTRHLRTHRNCCQCVPPPADIESTVLRVLVILIVILYKSSRIL